MSSFYGCLFSLLCSSHNTLQSRVILFNHRIMRFCRLLPNVLRSLKKRNTENRTRMHNFTSLHCFSHNRVRDSIWREFFGASVGNSWPPQQQSNRRSAHATSKPLWYWDPLFKALFLLPRLFWLSIQQSQNECVRFVLVLNKLLLIKK